MDLRSLTQRLAAGARANPILSGAIAAGLIARILDWVVSDTIPDDARRYAIVREFSVSEADSSLNVWGYDPGNYDRDFIVLRRITAITAGGG